MKYRTRPIARVGVFGTKENPTVVTKKDLQEIYDSFAGMDSAPIQLESNHDFSGKAPRFGEVVGLELKDDVLYGITKEHDVLYRVVDEGFYPDVSIGAQRSAETGKLYLHHVEYLGEEPPAIKDLRGKIKDSLATSQLAASDNKGGGENVILFPPANAKQLSLSDSSGKGVTMNELEELKKKVSELENANASLKLELEKAKNGTQGGSDGELEKVKAENEELKKKLNALSEKYPEEDLALSDANPQTKALMAELRKSKTDALLDVAKGKLPPACNASLIALADSLPVTGELALSDGKKLSAFDCLKNILEEMPTQSWTQDVLGLSDPNGNTKPESIDVHKMMAYM